MHTELPAPEPQSHGAVEGGPTYNHKKTDADGVTGDVGRERRFSAGWWLVPLLIAGVGLWAVIAWLLY